MVGFRPYQQTQYAIYYVRAMTETGGKGTCITNQKKNRRTRLKKIQGLKQA